LKIAFFSDIHISHWRQYISSKDLCQQLYDQCKGTDLVINAGDSEFKKFKWDVPYIEVKGNHDYYGNTLNELDWSWDKDRHILASTLWTNFGDNALCEWDASRFVNDFRLVQNTMLTEKMKAYYYLTVDLIYQFKPEIMVTHFGPFLQSIHPKYNGNSLNRYFVNDMQEILDVNPQIKLWIHGHVHDDFDYMIGNCRVVCHPCGYPNENYSRFEDYSPMIIEI